MATLPLKAWLVFSVTVATCFLIESSWGQATDSEKRTWQDSTGKFSCSAKLIDVQGSNVRLEKEDGKVITIPLAKLSQADQDFVQAAEKRTPQTAETTSTSPQKSTTETTYTLEQFTIRLPNRLEKMPIPQEKIPDWLQLVVWRSMRDAQMPELIVQTMSSSDPKMLEDAQQNMRQSLVNYSAGATDSMGIQILGRGKLESTVSNKVLLSNFTWVGKLGDMEVGGKAYGITYGDRFTALLFIAFGGNPDEEISKRDTIVKTIALK